jgi:hypothetical protein
MRWRISSSVAMATALISLEARGWFITNRLCYNAAAQDLGLVNN